MLWLLYAAFVLYGGTIPFHFSGDLAGALDRLQHLPLNPLISPDTGRRLSIPDVVQNVLLFVPFGALGMVSAGLERMRARRVVLVAATALLLSLTVEGLQLLTIDRTASTGDVLTNLTGALLGAGAAWVLANSVVLAVTKLREAGLADAPELKPFAIALGVLVIAAWQPFDATLEVGTVAGKIRALERDVWQFSGLRDEGIAVLLAAFFAMTLAGYLSVLGESRVARKTIALGAGLVFALEGVQVMIGSRMPGLWDALVMTGGVVVGTAIWASAGRILWPGLWLGVLVALTGVAAAMQMLSPFQIAQSYRPIGWFPFLGYYTRTTFETLSHVIELLLLYFPLGFWLGRTEPALGRAILKSVALVLLIAAPVECMQGWIVGRYPDVSDVAVGMAGAVLAVRLAWLSGRGPADLGPAA